jgi:hypothetical protein
VLFGPALVLWWSCRRTLAESDIRTVGIAVTRTSGRAGRACCVSLLPSLNRGIVCVVRPAAWRVVTRSVTVAATASAVSSAIRRCSVRAVSAGRFRRRAVPGGAKSGRWPLAVSAMILVRSLTCCRISMTRACRAAGEAGGVSGGGPPAC